MACSTNVCSTTIAPSHTDTIWRGQIWDMLLKLYNCADGALAPYQLPQTSTVEFVLYAGDAEVLRLTEAPNANGSFVTIDDRGIQGDTPAQVHIYISGTDTAALTRETYQGRGIEVLSNGDERAPFVVIDFVVEG